jgi:hypothetical protein
VLAIVTAGLAAAAVPAGAATPPAPQTDADSYTRYELLAPDTQSFRIVYDVSATTAGATRYWNPIRPGSEPTVHGVVDLHTGLPLVHRLVTGQEAAQHGLRDAAPDGRYIEIELARPVPDGGGEARLRIDKTYRDPASYRFETTDGARVEPGRAGSDALLVFERALGIPRNTIALPPGWELVGCNVPAQVRLGDSAGGPRVEVSFFERGPGPTPLRLVGRRLPARAAAATAPAASTTPSGAIAARPPETRSAPASARVGFDFVERARQDREIVYFLEPPETHSFRLYHDYTESRPGVDRYLNVVRPGSRASQPSARVLDTGETLRVETLRGDAIAARGIELDEPVAEPVAPDTEVVVIWFAPVEAGRSVRLRIEETYTDPGRYGLDGDELLFDRGLGRPRNTVVLPAGWWLGASAVPAVVDETDDGRLRLRFDNDGPDAIDVLVRARRR